MATVHIPASLRALCNGCEQVNCPANNLREVFEKLEARFPALAGKLRQADTITVGWAASIDGVIASQGMRTPLAPQCEIHFHPAIGGG